MPKKIIDLNMSDKVNIIMMRDTVKADLIARKYGISLTRVYNIWREANLINKKEAEFNIEKYNKKLLKIKKSKKPLLSKEIRNKNEESSEPVVKRIIDYEERIIDSDEEERIKKKRFKRSIDKINRSIERKMKKIDEKILTEANKIKTA